jgi:peptidoglycan hydrolase-like protein with peptidoglycan-binding domain
MIRAVQESLLALGFQSGPVDGIFGPQTRSALRSYQRENGLPEDGRLSELLIARILAAGLLADLERVR